MTAETFYYFATGFGVLLGLLGASWKWIFEEALRRHTDLPALEGTIECDVFDSGGEDVVVRVVSRWNNPTPRRIYLSCSSSRIYIYELHSQFVLGEIDLGSRDTQWLYSYAPYAHSDFVFYEPHTQSEFVATFKLERNRTYAARAFLVMDETKMGSKDRVWFRDGVFTTGERSKDEDGTPR